MQKWNLKRALAGNTFSVALIVLGGLILFWIRDYKEVPSGIGPAFFPRIVAFMMIGLSLISLIFPVSAPVIKCKKTPRKKCRFVAEVRKKR